MAKFDEALAAIAAGRAVKERLAAVLSRDYSLPVHEKTLETFCKQENLWSIRPDPITPSRVLKVSGRRPKRSGIARETVGSILLKSNLSLKIIPMLVARL